ncbi:MAG: glutamyl-tRNA reductase [Opitutae bacterium]|nr:glutamyl-tRNA reductase [Opitutae bacterium]
MTSGNEPLLFIIGSSHEQANLEDRETFSLKEDQAEALASDLMQNESIDECLILNTCNRLEIYAVSNKVKSIDDLHQFICSHQTLKGTSFPKYNFIKTQTDAIEHTFKLSSGLASQMIGETEILGQMKQAYTQAKQSKYTKQTLIRLFEKSFQAGKLIRTQTDISRGQVSIGTVALNLANRIFGKLKESRILLVGSGDVSEKTAQALKTKGVTDITVSGRSKDKTDTLAEKFGASSIHFENFKNQIQHFDIVISSTSAPNCVIDYTTIQKAIKSRPNSPLFLIDLAVPRDVEESISKLENVYLYNLDALASIANENMALRKSEIAKATQMIKAQAWNFWLQAFRRSMFQKHQ